MRKGLMGLAAALLMSGSAAHAQGWRPPTVGPVHMWTLYGCAGEFSCHLAFVQRQALETPGYFTGESWTEVLLQSQARAPGPLAVAGFQVRVPGSWYWMDFYGRPGHIPFAGEGDTFWMSDNTEDFAHMAPGRLTIEVTRELFPVEPSDPMWEWRYGDFAVVRYDVFDSRDDIVRLTFADVPEPGTLALLVLAAPAVALAGLRRRRRIR